LALNKPNGEMWDRVLKTFKQTLDKAEAVYTLKAQSELVFLVSLEVD